MRLQELAYEMAASLLRNPSDDIIEVWRVGDDWGWGRIGESSPPAEATIVVQDRVQNADAVPHTNPEKIAAYASDILQWLQEASA